MGMQSSAPKIEAAAPSKKEVEQLTKSVTEAAEEQNEEYNEAFANSFDVQKGEVWTDEYVKNLADLNKPAPQKNEKKGGCSGCCLILITTILLFLALGGYIYAEKKGLVKTDYFEAIDLPIASDSVTTEQPEITDSIYGKSLEQTERKASKKSKKSKRSRLLDMAL